MLLQADITIINNAVTSNVFIKNILDPQWLYTFLFRLDKAPGNTW